MMAPRRVLLSREWEVHDNGKRIEKGWGRRGGDAPLPYLA